jgi:superfamily II DNA or RNA helicase
MEAKLLCQFHYYGISDLTIDGLSVDDSSDTRFLTSIARSRHIKEAIDTYSMHEKRKRGLIFCRTVVEAKSFQKG